MSDTPRNTHSVWVVFLVYTCRVFYNVSSETQNVNLHVQYCNTVSVAARYKRSQCVARLCCNVNTALSASCARTLKASDRHLILQHVSDAKTIFTAGSLKQAKLTVIAAKDTAAAVMADTPDKKAIHRGSFDHALT